MTNKYAPTPHAGWRDNRGQVWDTEDAAIKSNIEHEIENRARPLIHGGGNTAESFARVLRDVVRKHPQLIRDYLEHVNTMTESAPPEDRALLVDFPGGVSAGEY